MRASLPPLRCPLSEWTITDTAFTSLSSFLMLRRAACFRLLFDLESSTFDRVRSVGWFKGCRSPFGWFPCLIFRILLMDMFYLLRLHLNKIYLIVLTPVQFQLQLIYSKELRPTTNSKGVHNVPPILTAHLGGVTIRMLAVSGWPRGLMEWVPPARLPSSPQQIGLS